MTSMSTRIHGELEVGLNRANNVIGSTLIREEVENTLIDNCDFT